MSKVRENWADYIQRMIERRIKEHEILEASRRIDEIRSKTRMNVYHATNTIREDRNKA
jgi:flagellar biosynthesis regulator FlbT